MKQIISKLDAEKCGEKRYFTGSPCKYGHIAERFVSNRCCTKCKDEDNLKRLEILYPNRERREKKPRKHGLNRREKAILYYLENKKKIIARSISWAKAHPDVVRAGHQNRRKKAKINGGKLSKDLPSKLLILQKSRCACCRTKFGKQGFHMDHILPLALGGPNSDENIQLLCPFCNMSKHAKHPIDFMQSRGFLV